MQESFALLCAAALSLLCAHSCQAVKSEWVPSAQPGLKDPRGVRAADGSHPGRGALKELGGVLFREGSYTAGFRHGNRLRGRQP